MIMLDFANCGWLPFLLHRTGRSFPIKALKQLYQYVPMVPVNTQVGVLITYSVFSQFSGRHPNKRNANWLHSHANWRRARQWHRSKHPINFIELFMGNSFCLTKVQCEIIGVIHTIHFIEIIWFSSALWNLCS